MYIAGCVSNIIETGVKVLQAIAGSLEAREDAISLSIEAVRARTMHARSALDGRLEAIEQAEGTIEQCFEDWSELLYNANDGDVWAKRGAHLMPVLAKRILQKYQDGDTANVRSAQTVMLHTDLEISTWADGFEQGYQEQKDELTKDFPARIEQFALLTEAVLNPIEEMLADD